MRKPKQQNTAAILDLEWSFQEYMAAHPWERLKDHHVFRLPHPYHAHDSYAVAMGDGGVIFGVTVHTGPEAEQDVLATITGQAAVFAIRLAAMTTLRFGDTGESPPTMICQRMEPADNALGIVAQALFGPRTPVSTAERRALDHALRAATDIVSNPDHPQKLVRDRDHDSQIHLVTSVLEEGTWRHTVEVATVSPVSDDD